MCSWIDLDNGQITFIELMDMHRSMNLSDYLDDLNRQMQEDQPKEVENGNRSRRADNDTWV